MLFSPPKVEKLRTEKERSETTATAATFIREIVDIELYQTHLMNGWWTMPRHVAYCSSLPDSEPHAAIDPECDWTLKYLAYSPHTSTLKINWQLQNNRLSWTDWLCHSHWVNYNSNERCSKHYQSKESKKVSHGMRASPFLTENNTCQHGKVGENVEKRPTFQGAKNSGIAMQIENENEPQSIMCNNPVYWRNFSMAFLCVCCGVTTFGRCGYCCWHFFLDLLCSVFLVW